YAVAHVELPAVEQRGYVRERRFQGVADTDLESGPAIRDRSAAARQVRPVVEFRARIEEADPRQRQYHSEPERADPEGRALQPADRTGAGQRLAEGAGFDQL